MTVSRLYRALKHKANQCVCEREKERGTKAESGDREVAGKLK